MMFLHGDNHLQNKGYIQSGTLKILLSVHAPNRGRKGVLKKGKGLPHAEVAHKVDTKGQAHMMFVHRDNHMQNEGYIQSRTLKILRSKKEGRKGLKKGKGLPHAEVTHKVDTKGQAHIMLLHGDNHLQNKGYIQSRTLKILLSVHAPNRGTKGDKNKSKGQTPCRGHPKGKHQGASSP